MNPIDFSEHSRWVQAAVAEYEGRLLRYAAQITGDRERAADVVQDTFLKLCRQSRPELDGHLAEWLYTVCRNRALDMHRREKRMRALTVEQEQGESSAEPDQTLAVEQQDLARHVLQLVAGLSENQQEVVRLKFQDGLSYREISRITQLSVSNVGYLIHTAIQRLRTQLDPPGPSDTAGG
jgi:RNA polymerase sigma-70 factor (ECF subfamily)